MNYVTRFIWGMTRCLSAWAWRPERDYFDASLKIKSLSMEDGSMELELEQHPNHAQWMAMCLASMIHKSPNYTEMTFKPPATKYKDKWEWITVTIKKGCGLTPHQLMVEAKEKLAALQVEMNSLRAAPTSMVADKPTPSE